jgi:hypothetical protein
MLLLVAAPCMLAALKLHVMLITLTTVDRCVPCQLPSPHVTGSTVWNYMALLKGLHTMHMHKKEGAKHARNTPLTIFFNKLMNSGPQRILCHKPACSHATFMRAEAARPMINTQTMAWPQRSRCASQMNTSHDGQSMRLDCSNV